MIKVFLISILLGTSTTTFASGCDWNSSGIKKQIIEEFTSKGTLECWEYGPCEIKLANYANRSNDIILTSSPYVDSRFTFKEDIHDIKVRVIKNTEYGSCYNDLIFYSVEAIYGIEVYTNHFAISNSW